MDKKNRWLSLFCFVFFGTMGLLGLIVWGNNPAALWWVLPVTAVSFLTLGWYTQQRIIRPIRRLAEAIETAAPGEQKAPILATTRSDADRLIRSFNQWQRNQNDRISLLGDERQLLFTVFSQMSDAVIVTNRAGHVTIFNTAAAHLFDLDAEEAVGRTLTELLLHHEIIDLWHRCTDQQTEQATIVDVRDGGLFLQVNIMPFAGDGGDGYIVIISDLTTVRRLETVRRDFISNVSHELKTPLAALSAVVETLQDGALDDRPIAEKFLNRAANEVDTMTQMVSELLELARIESGRVPLRLTPTTLHPIAHATIDHLQSFYKRKNLHLDVVLPPHLPPILADHARLQQVLVNLCHNAFKFTPENGTVTVSAEAQAEHIIVKIADTGIGIATDDLPRIFERFYKIDRARNSSGTGLGLAIAKHLIQAHNGDIWAESVEGKGSTFFISLPIYKA